MRDQSHAPSKVHAPRSVLAYDLETIAPEQSDGSFPPWPTHRPIAAGFAVARQRDGKWAFELDAMVADPANEAVLAREADARMATAEVVTSYNGRGFDALVLRLAAQRSRMFGLKALANHAASPRFAGEHADLADLYASYNRKVALASLCEQIGIPVKTTTSGADVAALWVTGERDRIREYVMEDATATLCLYFCWLAARAGDEALVTRPLTALARHIEATPDLHYLHAFVDCPLTRWARPKSLQADLGAALGRIQQRLKREEDEAAFASS